MRTPIAQITIGETTFRAYAPQSVLHRSEDEGPRVAYTQVVESLDARGRVIRAEIQSAIYDGGRLIRIDSLPL